jgi:hypothetical protein
MIVWMVVEDWAVVCLGYPEPQLRAGRWEGVGGELHSD